jgi:transposase
VEDKRKYPISLERFKKLIEPLIEEDKKKSGRPLKFSHYQFFCGVLYVLRTGIAWRDLPADYGHWHTIYTRYKRWSEKGFFWSLLSKLQGTKEALLDVIFVDGSIVPLHRHGGGALKKERTSSNR